VELKEYLKIVQRNLGLIIVVTILVALFAYIFTAKQPVTYEANANFTIIPKSAAELKNVYEYDGYYALQAAVLFGNTLASWLQSPDIVVEIFKKAGYELEKTQSSKSLAKLIKPTLVPNSFSVKFQLKDRDENKAQKLAQATTEIVQNKTTEFNQRAGSKANFEVAASEPIILEVKPKKEFNTMVGALAGLILGVFLAFVRQYFRK
jgi:capsular polysaccharide biosynthesis protein